VDERTRTYIIGNLWEEDPNWAQGSQDEKGRSLYIVDKAQRTNDGPESAFRSMGPSVHREVGNSAHLSFEQS
jgi:hypothetical protein